MNYRLGFPVDISAARNSAKEVSRELPQGYYFLLKAVENRLTQVFLDVHGSPIYVDFAIPESSGIYSVLGWRLRPQYHFAIQGSASIGQYSISSWQGRSDGLAAYLASLDVSPNWEDLESSNKPIVLVSVEFRASNDANYRTGKIGLAAVTGLSPNEEKAKSLLSKWEAAILAANPNGCALILHEDDAMFLREILKDHPDYSGSNFKAVGDTKEFALTPGHLTLYALGQADLPKLVDLLGLPPFMPVAPVNTVLRTPKRNVIFFIGVLAIAVLALIGFSHLNNGATEPTISKPFMLPRNFSGSYRSSTGVGFASLSIESQRKRGNELEFKFRLVGWGGDLYIRGTGKSNNVNWVNLDQLGVGSVHFLPDGKIKFISDTANSSAWEFIEK